MNKEQAADMLKSSFWFVVISDTLTTARHSITYNSYAIDFNSVILLNNRFLINCFHFINGK